MGRRSGRPPTSEGAALARRASAVLGVLLTAGLAAAGARAWEVQQPAWVADLEYRASELFAVRPGYLRMPFLEVAVGDSIYWLLFDTGNMVGLTLATPLLDQLRLPEVGRWDRLDANGRVVGRFRTVRAPAVRVLGRTRTDQVIAEFGDAQLGGLVGPDAVPGSRFTLDYESGLLAVTSSSLVAVPADFVALPLTRSERHPRLILVSGRVNGRATLMELDTGASRTNLDPTLVRELHIPQAGDGVRLESLALGPYVFTVPSAKINPKAGIDTTLSPPIQLAVGSDILRQVVLTVDYAGGQVLLRRVRRR